MSLYNTNTAESELDITWAATEEEEGDEVDTVEKPISTDGWHIFGRECPKEEIVFLCQVINQSEPSSRHATRGPLTV